ncbi:unnamed protein product [Diamesa hyperborea]
MELQKSKSIILSEYQTPCDSEDRLKEQIKNDVFKSESQNEQSENDDNLELRLDDMSLHSNAASSDINDNERAQIESFFSGLGTEVFVSSSLANLYEGIHKKDWRLVYTGVPVLLYDKGSARSRSSPRVTFVLAERITCFVLWKDTIDSYENYKVLGPTLHTITLSGDDEEKFGISYFSNAPAVEVRQAIRKMLTSPEIIALSTPLSKRKSKKKSKPQPLPPKCQISNPCQFFHVNNITSYDYANLPPIRES